MQSNLSGTYTNRHITLGSVDGEVFGQSLQHPSVRGNYWTPPELNSLTAAWRKLSVGPSCSKCSTASPRRLKWRVECLWEVEHFIIWEAFFVHLVLNLSGLREAASNPLCCRHYLPPSRRTFAMPDSDPWAADRTKPPSPTYLCFQGK